MRALIFAIMASGWVSGSNTNERARYEAIEMPEIRIEVARTFTDCLTAQRAGVSCEEIELSVEEGSIVFARLAR